MKVIKKRVKKKGYLKNKFIKNCNNIKNKTGLILLSCHYNKLKDYSEENLNYYNDKLLVHFTTYYNVFIHVKKLKNQNINITNNYGFPTLNSFYNLSKIPEVLENIFDLNLIYDYTPIFIDKLTKTALYAVVLNENKIHLLKNNNLNMGKIITNSTCNLFKLESLYKTNGLIYQSILSQSVISCNTNLGLLNDNLNLFNINKSIVFDYISALVPEDKTINTYLEMNLKQKLLI